MLSIVVLSLHTCACGSALGVSSNADCDRDHIRVIRALSSDCRAPRFSAHVGHFPTLRSRAPISSSQTPAPQPSPLSPGLGDKQPLQKLGWRKTTRRHWILPLKQFNRMRGSFICLWQPKPGRTMRKKYLVIWKKYLLTRANLYTYNSVIHLTKNRKNHPIKYYKTFLRLQKMKKWSKMQYSQRDYNTQMWCSLNQQLHGILKIDIMFPKANRKVTIYIQDCHRIEQFFFKWLAFFFTILLISQMCCFFSVWFCSYMGVIYSTFVDDNVNNYSFGVKS